MKSTEEPDVPPQPLTPDQYKIQFAALGKQLLEAIDNQDKTKEADVPSTAADTEGEAEETTDEPNAAGGAAAEAEEPADGSSATEGTAVQAQGLFIRIADLYYKAVNEIISKEAQLKLAQERAEKSPQALIDIEWRALEKEKKEFESQKAEYDERIRLATMRTQDAIEDKNEATANVKCLDMENSELKKQVDELTSTRQWLEAKIAKLEELREASRLAQRTKEAGSSTESEQLLQQIQALEGQLKEKDDRVRDLEQQLERQEEGQTKHNEEKLQLLKQFERNERTSIFEDEAFQRQQLKRNEANEQNVLKLLSMHEEYEKIIKQLSEKIHEKQLEISENKALYTEQAEQIEELQQENAELRQMLEERTKFLTNIREQLETQETAATTESTDSPDAITARATKAADGMTEQIKILESIANLQTELEKMGELSDTLSALKEKITALESKNKELQQELGKKYAEDAENAEKFAEQAQNISEAMSRLTSLTAELEEAQLTNTKKKERYKTLEETLGEQAKTIQDQLAELQAFARQSLIHSEEAGMRQIMLSESDGRNQLITEHLAKLKAEHVKSVQEAAAKSATLNEEITKGRASLEESNTSIAKLKEQLSTEKDGNTKQIAQLNEKLGQLTADKEHQAQTLSSLQAKLASLQNESAAKEIVYEEGLRKAQQELETTQAQLAGPLESLQKSIAEKGAELANLNASSNASTETIATLKEELKNEKETAEKQRAELAGANSRANELQASVKNQTAEISKLETQAKQQSKELEENALHIAQLEEEKKSVEAALTSVKDIGQQKDDKLRKLQSEKEKIEAAQARTLEANTLLEEKKKATDKELAKSKVTLAQLEQERSRLMDQLKQSKLAAESNEASMNALKSGLTQQARHILTLDESNARSALLLEEAEPRSELIKQHFDELELERAKFIQAAIDESTKLSKQIEELNAEVAANKAAQEKQKEDIESLTKERTRLESSLAENKEKSSVELTELTEEKKELDEQLSKAKRKLSELESGNANKQSQLTHLETELTRTKQDIEKQAATHKAEVEGISAKLQEKIAQLQAKETELKAAEARSGAEIADLKAQIESAKKKPATSSIGTDTSQFESSAPKKSGPSGGSGGGDSGGGGSSSSSSTTSQSIEEEVKKYLRKYRLLRKKLDEEAVTKGLIDIIGKHFLTFNRIHNTVYTTQDRNSLFPIVIKVYLGIQGYQEEPKELLGHLEQQEAELQNVKDSLAIKIMQKTLSKAEVKSLPKSFGELLAASRSGVARAARDVLYSVCVKELVSFIILPAVATPAPVLGAALGAVGLFFLARGVVKAVIAAKKAFSPDQTKCKIEFTQFTSKLLEFWPDNNTLPSLAHSFSIAGEHILKEVPKTEIQQTIIDQCKLRATPGSNGEQLQQTIAKAVQSPGLLERSYSALFGSNIVEKNIQPSIRKR